MNTSVLHPLLHCTYNITISELHLKFHDQELSKKIHFDMEIRLVVLIHVVMHQVLLKTTITQWQPDTHTGVQTTNANQ